MIRRKMRKLLLMKRRMLDGHEHFEQTKRLHLYRAPAGAVDLPENQVIRWLTEQIRQAADEG